MRVTRLMAAAVVSAAVLVGGVGCSKDTDASDTITKAQLTAFKKSGFIKSGAGFLTDKQITCLAEELLPELTAKQEKVLKDADDSFASKDLGKAGQKALAKAFNACATIESYLKASKKQSAEMGETGTCTFDVIEKASADYKGLGDFMVALEGDLGDKLQEQITSDCASSTDSTDATDDSTDTSSDDVSGMSADAVKSALESELTQQGLTAEQASCVAGKIADNYSAADLTTTDETKSAELQEFVGTAMTDCGVES